VLTVSIFLEYGLPISHLETSSTSDWLAVSW